MDDTRPAAPAFPKLREVPVEQPLVWLRRGWGDLLGCPLPSLFYGACFAGGGALMVLALGGAPEYIAAVTSGFLIGGPFFAIGLYEISRRREKGQSCSLGPTLTAWRGNAGNLGLFTALLLVIFLVWARASMVVFALFYSGEMPTLSGFLRHVVSTDHLGFLAAYFAVGGLFALIAFAISLIAIPLMLDRGHDAITASIASVRALFMNPGAMFVWAGLIALLGGLGLLTFLAGMLVIGPLLGHATWHAYRDLVE
ncbi:MAG: DUF2189 domain-containing protein [Rhodocyclaceae bacterium]|jgi:uncharacterized membrane protein|nr:DUF2189 domain-containing protein [Rhodocyclaceae bacterium]